MNISTIIATDVKQNNFAISDHAPAHLLFCHPVVSLVSISHKQLQVQTLLKLILSLLPQR